MWQSFASRHQLTENQLHQFKQFYDLLKKYNDLINLTSINEPQAIITHHFDDSLILKNFLDLTTYQTLADVGTGGGFPGIPLKIVFPHLNVYLIEVTEKKIAYLKKVIEALELDNTFVIGFDWRTFLRKTTYEVEVFCARASLPPLELIRMFKPASYYKNAQLVYWASRHWSPEGKEEKFLLKEEDYRVGNRTRKLVFFEAQI